MVLKRSGLGATLSTTDAEHIRRKASLDILRQGSHEIVTIHTSRNQCSTFDVVGHDELALYDLVIAVQHTQDGEDLGMRLSDE